MLKKYELLGQREGKVSGVELCADEWDSLQALLLQGEYSSWLE